jgi:hypothetical protein
MDIITNLYTKAEELMTRYADGTTLGRHSDGKLHVDVPDPGPDPLTAEIIQIIVAEFDEEDPEAIECLSENWYPLAKRLADFVRDKMAVA